MHQVATLSVGQGTYFTTTGREDYYLKGGEPLGLWRAGAGSDALGVHGIVHASEFHNLLNGFSADGTEKLVQQQHFTQVDEHGQKLREKCAAHDLTFSAPKTYSVVRAVVPPELAAHMDQAMRRALDRSLDFVQDEAGFSRKKVAGEIKPIRADLAFAMFEHRTSRSLDPHWHYHCVIPNVARCEDGKFRTVNGYNFYQLQHASWHVFEAEFAKELRALGFHIVRKGKSFEIAGVPEALCEEFSKRRHEILRAVEEFGSASGKVRELAALSTREVKQAVPHELLYKAWRDISREHGFTSLEAQALTRGPKILETTRGQDGSVRTKTADDILAQACSELSKRESSFSRRQFFAEVALQAQTSGLGSLYKEAREYLESSPDLQRSFYKGSIRYVTRETWELEAQIISRLELSKDSTSHVVHRAVFEGGLLKAESAQGFALGTDQRRALEAITLETGSIKVVTGLAGTGKSTLLNAAREIWERNGETVLGCAISGRAATGLEESSGIKSESVARTLKLIETGKLRITDRTVLCVDESGMLDSIKAAKLLSAVSDAGGKVVFCGDGKQIQAIGPSGVLQGAEARLGAAHLTEVVRQAGENRDAALKFRTGDSAEALKSYATRDLVHVSANWSQATRRLVSDWEKDGGLSNPKDFLIVAAEKREVSRLNALAQQRAYEAGKLEAGENISVKGQAFFKGDRALFTHTSKVLGVDNGNIGTISRIDRGRRLMDVRLDNGREITVNLRSYDHIEAGWAVTTHKGQGTTVEKHTYALIGGSNLQDLHLSYVQATRAKGDTKFYTTRMAAGENLEHLAKQMSQDREKRFGHDLGERLQAGPEEEHRLERTL